MNEIEHTNVELLKKKSYDLRIIIGRNSNNNQMNSDIYGVDIYYFYKIQKLLIEWVTSPRNDSLSDTICLLIL